MSHLGQPSPSLLPPAVHQTEAPAVRPWRWEGGLPPSPWRAAALLLALSGLQRGEARLQGAWKRDRGCLFSCLSWRRPPYWGLVFLELKHTALSPHRAVTFSKQDFSVGGLRGKPPSGRQQASPLARAPWRHRPWTATLSEHVSLVCLWFCVRQGPCVLEADSSTISLGHLRRSILESNPGMGSTEEPFAGVGG